jgi:hypothetical protein
MDRIILSRCGLLIRCAGDLPKFLAVDDELPWADIIKANLQANWPLFEPIHGANLS